MSSKFGRFGSIDSPDVAAPGDSGPLANTSYFVYTMLSEGGDIVDMLDSLGGKRLYTASTQAVCVLTTSETTTHKQHRRKLDQAVSKGLQLVNAMPWLQECQRTNSKVPLSARHLLDLPVLPETPQKQYFTVATPSSTPLRFKVSDSSDSDSCDKHQHFPSQPMTQPMAEEMEDEEEEEEEDGVLVEAVVDQPTGLPEGATSRYTLARDGPSKPVRMKGGGNVRPLTAGELSDTDVTLHDYRILQNCHMAENKNKFYVMELISSGKAHKIVTHYGRTDDLEIDPNSGRREVRVFPDEEMARQYFAQLCTEKYMVKEYSDVKLVTATVGTAKLQQVVGEKGKSVPRGEAPPPRPTPTPDVLELVDMLYAEANKSLTAVVCARITAQGITTPLGVLSPAQIAEGDQLLDKLEALVQGGGVSKAELQKASSAFFTCIPHRLGRYIGETSVRVMDKLSQITEKRELLQLMRDIHSLSGAASQHETVMKYNALRCDVKTINPAVEEFRTIVKVVEAQKRKNYTNQVKLTRAFRVTRPDDQKTFNTALSNRTKLLHGSKPGNFVGILSRGLLMPRTIEALHGRRTNFGWLGAGVYFADASCTSGRYSLPAASGKSYAVVATVALGNVKEFTELQPQLADAPAGFNSVKGVGKEMLSNPDSSDFVDNEYAVYNPSQFTVSYVVELDYKARLPPPEERALPAPLEAVVSVDEPVKMPPTQASPKRWVKPAKVAEAPVVAGSAFTPSDLAKLRQDVVADVLKVVQGTFATKAELQQFMARAGPVFESGALSGPTLGGFGPSSNSSGFSSGFGFGGGRGGSSRKPDPFGGVAKGAKPAFGGGASKTPDYFGGIGKGAKPAFVPCATQPPAGKTTLISPGLPVDQEDFIVAERQLREQYAQGVTKDRYEQLLDVYSIDTVSSFKYEDLTPAELDYSKLMMRYVRPVTCGAPSILPAASFNQNLSTMLQGQLDGLNWDNVFLGGGCVLGAMLPSDVGCGNAFRGADIDLFMYGIDNDEAALQKLHHIIDTVKANRLRNKNDMRGKRGQQDECIMRTPYAVTLVGTYPFRHVQIVLRMYKSPSEVLVGFDVDACTVGYDGRTWANRRARRAINKQMNVVDLTRRSLTYEVRLSKYARRGFAVGVPGIDLRAAVVPKVPVREAQGLRKLLVMDSLQEAEVTTARQTSMFPQKTAGKKSRAMLRNRRKAFPRSSSASKKEDWSGSTDEEGVTESDYSNVLLPWGPAWSSWQLRARIVKKDQASFFANRGMHHRHIALAGPGALEGFASWCSTCCQLQQKKCTSMPSEADVGGPLDAARSKYVFGTPAWVREDPGRQLMTGSFHPVTDDLWAKDVEASAAPNAPPSPFFHQGVDVSKWMDTAGRPQATAPAATMPFGQFLPTQAAPLTQPTPGFGGFSGGFGGGFGAFAPKAPSQSAPMKKTATKKAMPKKKEPVKPEKTVRGPSKTAFASPHAVGPVGLGSGMMAGLCKSEFGSIMTFHKERTELPERVLRLVVFDLFTILSNTSNPGSLKWNYSKDRLDQEVSSGSVLVLIGQAVSMPQRLAGITAELMEEYPFVAAVFAFAATKGWSSLPHPAAFNIFKNEFAPKSTFDEIVYVGSQGREFHDLHYKFAVNCGMSYETPEEYFAGASQAVRPGQKFDPRSFRVSGSIKRWVPRRPGDPKRDVPEFEGRWVVLMVGRPGSGKSSFHKRYLGEKGFVYVNNDSQLGMDVAVQAVAMGASVVVDNMNLKRDTRRPYIELARTNGFKVATVHMDTPKEIAQHMNALRRWVSCGQTEPVPAVVYAMYDRDFQEPQESEGIDTIVDVPFVPEFDTPLDEKFFFMLP